jgi:raffinose/stachyose/melibiose transport system permease protein
LVVTCASLAGYALARLRFRGAALMYVVFLGAQATPILILIVPLFVLVTRMGLGNSLLAVVLPYAAMNMGITVFLMRGFFRTIPSDLEDAARIDGCGQVGLIWRVMAPLARPGIVVAVLLNFVAFWNEYFLAAILLPSRDLFTLPAGIAVEFSARYATNWPAVAAGVMISILPTLLIFIFAQDKIIAGWARSVR